MAFECGEYRLCMRREPAEIEIAPRSLHRDPQRVIDVAARDFVVSNDRWQNREACGIGRRPSLGSHAIAVQIERGHLRRLPTRAGQARLIELVEAPAGGIDDD